MCGDYLTGPAVGALPTLPESPNVKLDAANGGLIFETGGVL